MAVPSLQALATHALRASLGALFDGFDIKYEWRWILADRRALDGVLNLQWVAGAAFAERALGEWTDAALDDLEDVGLLVEHLGRAADYPRYAQAWLADMLATPDRPRLPPAAAAAVVFAACARGDAGLERVGYRRTTQQTWRESAANLEEGRPLFEPNPLKRRRWDVEDEDESDAWGLCAPSAVGGGFAALYGKGRIF